MHKNVSKQKLREFIREERERAEKYSQLNVVAVLMALDAKLDAGKLDAETVDGSDNV